MNLIPWKNKRAERERVLPPLAELRSEMDRLFESALRQPFGSLMENFSFQGGWDPVVDVAQNETEVIVRAELPGVDPKDLDLSVTGSRLAIAGEKKECQEQKAKGYFRSESRYGSFERVVELPGDVDAERVTADYANGVLTVRLQKTLAATPKRIPVNRA